MVPSFPCVISPPAYSFRADKAGVYPREYEAIVKSAGEARVRDYDAAASDLAQDGVFEGGRLVGSQVQFAYDLAGEFLARWAEAKA